MDLNTICAAIGWFDCFDSGLTNQEKIVAEEPRKFEIGARRDACRDRPEACSTDASDSTAIPVAIIPLANPKRLIFPGIFILFQSHELSICVNYQ